MAGQMTDLAKTRIGQAIAMKSIDGLKQCLRDGEDPLRKDRKGNTYIHFVCTMYRPNIFQIITATGIDVCAQNKHGNTALHVTALQKECCHVGDLMAAGIDPFIRNKDGKTAAELKSQNKYWHTIYNVWQPGIYKVIEDHDVPRLLELLHCWNRVDFKRHGQTLRQFSAALKHHDIVWILDEHKPTLDLIYGVQEINYEKIRKALTKLKCNVNFLNTASNRPHILQHAIGLQNLKLVHILCNAKADVNTPIFVNDYYWGPLFFEVLNNKMPPQIMWKILESNPDFSLKDQRGRNALTFSLDKSSGKLPLSVFEYILKNGAYFAERDETGATIRDVARFARRSDVVDLIDKCYVKIMRNSDVDQLEQLAMAGYDSFHIYHNYRDTYIFACGNETKDVLKFMLWLPQFQESVQTFHRLVKTESVNQVKEFLDKHDKPRLLVNSKDKGGRAPLHLAVLWNKPDIVKFLLSCPDININAKDCCYRTAYHYACALLDDGFKIRKMLTDAGIDQNTLDTHWKMAKDYCELPTIGQWIERERRAKYGLELELMCIDKYEELYKIISSKKKGLKEFNESIKKFKFPVVKFSSVLDPLMPNFKDLLFLAVDYGKQEVAKKLAHLGADLTRKEMYLPDDCDEDAVSQTGRLPMEDDKPTRKTSSPILNFEIKEENPESPTRSVISSLTESLTDITGSSFQFMNHVAMEMDNKMVALTVEERARSLGLTELAEFFVKKLKRRKSGIRL
ncbi:uncharacterized protein LOC121373279 [Gigantopelta aegis]|uniref:uncharacterized protein LOC121373279 n=1 Tax=Gigantopelta aegis TaxID=1735272 RepID=UPI001B889230|nr:uncharacterized protein LOC121373279 [Gigantopelta aegis]